MIEISLNKINKNYGFNSVLNDLSFDIKTGDRICLIGSNGCGKTTALKLIMGIENADSGQINIRKGAKVGYLSQIPPIENNDILANDVYLRGVKDLIELDKCIESYTNIMSSSEKSIKELSKLQEEFRIKGGYQLKERIEKIKFGFKLNEAMLNTNYNLLSGGEKTIINLASLVLSNPDILLLDEPTNHLDIETLEWFEEYLNNYKGAILFVSHDRYFINRVCNKIISIENGHEDIYCGNYSYYMTESEKRFLLQVQRYKNQQKEIKSMQEAVIRLKQWGNNADNPIFFRRANAILKRIDRMEKVDKPHEKKNLNINLDISSRSANCVLSIKNLDLQIDNKSLLFSSEMNVYHKERVCLIGKNGCGKTTLIKNILNNTHDCIKLGVNVSIGYIPQEIRFINEELTIYEYMRSIYSGSESELRSKLSKFYFDEESIFKKLKTISGGEKVRIKLFELILKKANFLILDEPTNHIDINTREILEQSLLDFDGTILFISHDRYFINKIATKIIRFENNKLITYNGNYDYLTYLDSKREKPVIVEKKKVEITGSNRLDEFLKDATRVEEITIGCNSKVYKIRKKSKIFYLKIANHLSKESIMLDYLYGKINVPKKIFYEKYNNKSYILSHEVKGEMLCSDYYCAHPLEGIDILIEAFNELYNIDYSDCVVDETIDTKIKEIEDRFPSIKDNDINEDILNRFHTKESILKYLKGNKPKQIIGFTHGDMSLPNIYAFDHHFSGLIDVGNAGMSDIYYDLVVCEISIERNYGRKYIDIFYDKIGIEKDEFKSDYYRVFLSL